MRLRDRRVIIPATWATIARSCHYLSFAQPWLYALGFPSPEATCAKVLIRMAVPLAADPLLSRGGTHLKNKDPSTGACQRPDVDKKIDIFSASGHSSRPSRLAPYVLARGSCCPGVWQRQRVFSIRTSTYYASQEGVTPIVSPSESERCAWSASEGTGAASRGS
jgi:hypothetical protein